MTISIRSAISLFLISALSFSPATKALTVEEKLRLVVEVYELKNDLCEVDQTLLDKQKAQIGEVLFETPVLSGNYDTSCRKCHLEEHTLTDGLPMAVGVGGEGQSTERLHSDGVVVPRNAFTLFGRGNKHFNVFFWDGKVQAQDGQIYSPIGEGYSKGFQSPLSVAAVLPLLARDEFLGKQSTTESTLHLDLINSSYYAAKIEAANSVLQSILEDKNNEFAQKLRLALENQQVEARQFTLPFVGNSLASFIAQEISECPETAWGNYLDGDKDALDQSQKQGAVIFFGKGRCAACHSGSNFTDLDFHSIGVPQGNLGPHIHGQDIGRAGVTFKTEDRYKFRTPSLLLVSKTPPYGHNGEFKTLDEVIRFHINPIPFFAQKGWNSDRELLTYGKILGSRSDLLKYIDVSSQKEVEQLVDFLNTL